VRGVLIAVVVGILMTAFLVPLGLESLQHSEHTLRIIVAILMISPLAIVMGMAFPFGIRELERTGHNELIPWAWAVNGVSGVFATAFGMLTAMTFGYTVLLVVGACAYVVTIFAARPSAE
jgi:membrane protease YdiL (CAAX protease family)